MVLVLNFIVCEFDHFFFHILKRFLEPLKPGSYPAAMVKKVQKRLPRFTKEQSLMVQGSFDFLGLNYYTSNYASDIPC